jgi:hypothetical protein
MLPLTEPVEPQGRSLPQILVALRAAVADARSAKRAAKRTAKQGKNRVSESGQNRKWESAGFSSLVGRSERI